MGYNIVLFKEFALLEALIQEEQNLVVEEQDFADEKQELANVE